MLRRSPKPGDVIPSLVKDPITKVQLLKYAGAADDYALVHTDVETARAAGFDDVIAHGMLSAGFLGQMVAAWAGPENVRRIKSRFVALVHLGDVLTCKGIVRSITPVDRRCLATLDIWAENQKNEIVTVGEAEVYAADG